MKTTIICIYFFFAIIILISCVETPDDNAQKMKLEDIRNSPSYFGFNNIYNDYIPIDTIIHDIKKNFDISKHKILIFTSPSCYTCNRIDSLFPYFAKVLVSSEIPETNFEIYSMPSTKAEHPYKSTISISFLPTFVVMKENHPYYSITDTLRYLKENYPDIKYSLEYLLVESLK